MIFILCERELVEYGYEEGHFKLGQTVYFVGDKIHRFSLRKKCVYCNSSGYVLIKGIEFKCPNCNGAHESKEVIERVVDQALKIESVLTFKNKKKSFEIYSTGDNGLGIMIQRGRDGYNRYFGSKEEAQKECDKYNEKNGVYVLLNKYMAMI